MRKFSGLFNNISVRLSLGLFGIVIIIVVIEFYIFGETQKLKTIILDSGLINAGLAQTQTELLKEIEVINKTVFNFLIFSLSMASLFGIGIAILISYSVKMILKGVDNVNKGNTSYRINIISENEFGRIAKSFNGMLDVINKQITEVESSKKILESKNAKLNDAEKALLNILEDAKKLEEELQDEHDKLSATISSVGDGVLVLDINTNILMMNYAAENMFGVKSELVENKKIDTIIKFLKNDETPLEYSPINRMLESGEVYKVRIEDSVFIESQAGKKFPVAMTISPIFITGGGIVIVFQDITEERKLDEARSSFISIASHQLKTPLTAIRWFNELLISGDAGELNENQRKVVTQVYNSTLNLIELLNTLLYLAKIESGKIETEKLEIDLAQFTNNIAQELSPLTKIKNINIVIKNSSDHDIKVVSDSIMLKQVIMNLISNSIRYTDSGDIVVNINSIDEEIIYSVKDNGIGIPQEEKTRIFERFFRAKNASSKVPDGSGLGLHLVKSLVNAWGGKVWFDSEENKGTTFYFTIPIKK